MRPAFSILAVLAVAASAAANPVIVKSYPWANAHYGLGLLLGEPTTLRIASEDLTISPDLVRIRYVFANDDAAPRDETLYFPLPDIDIGRYWFDPAQPGSGPWRSVIGRHTGDPLNFVNFQVAVDGKPVAVRGKQFARAWRRTGLAGPVEAVDVTDELKQAGLPVLLLEKSDVIDRLPEVERHALFDAHLLGTQDSEDELAAGGYPKAYYPAWRVSTNFSWQQTFPANGSVTVDVTYQPVTGGTLRPVRGDKLLEYPDPSCFNDWRDRDLRARKSVSSLTTGYILDTAKYWNGPIGRFHLTIDKLKATNLLTVCSDGKLKQTSPTTYEFTAENFVPSQNITMLVLE
jgi:hypothetical protein